MWEPALNEAKVYPEDQICRRCLTCEWLEMTHKVRSQNDRPLRGCVGEVWPSDQLFQHSSCLPFSFPPTFLLSFVWWHGIPQIAAVMLTELDWSRKLLFEPQAFQNYLDSASQPAQPQIVNRAVDVFLLISRGTSSTPLRLDPCLLFFNHHDSSQTSH